MRFGRISTREVPIGADERVQARMFLILLRREIEELTAEPGRAIRLQLNLLS